MNRLRFNLSSLAAGVFALTCAATTSRAQILYSQTFDNATANAPVSNYGFFAYRGSGATDISAVTSGTDATQNGQVSVGSTSGNPTPPTGYLYATNGNTTSGGTLNVFSIVHFFSLGMTVPSSASNNVTFTMGNTNASSAARVLVQIGGNGTTDGSGTWYVSNQFSSTTTYTGATFAAAATSAVTYGLNLNTTSSIWRAFTLVPGTSMTTTIPSATTTLPSNTITAIGFYADPAISQNTVRLDSFAVGVVPEPSGMVFAFMIGGTALFAMRRQLRGFIGG